MNTDRAKFLSVCICVNLWLLCFSTGCSTFREVGEKLNGEPKKKAALFTSNRPDDRRDAVLFFADHDYGLKDPYVRYYRQMARQDTDPLVRATAIRALNRARDKEATPIFIEALTDNSVWVRLEGAKALNRVPDPKAIDPLLKVATSNDEVKDVRIAAAEALEHYRNLDVARQLISLLNHKDFGIAWQARRSLKGMTGKDLSYDENAWLQYITGASKPLG